MTFLVWEMETGEQGTPHIQGFVHFKARVTWNSLRTRIFSDKGFYKLAKGSDEENQRYCSKDREKTTDWAEHGKPDPRGQGHRSDLERATEAIKAGMSMKEVSTTFSNTFVRYAPGLKQLSLYIHDPPAAKRNVRSVVLWGPTGTGKTHRVRTAFPNVFEIAPGRGPFDTYEYEKTILFEEFAPEDWPIREMNRLLDVWPCTLNCRFHNKKAAWTRVFICSNLDPQDWYLNENSKVRDAFWRRIHMVNYVETRDTPTELNPLPTEPSSPAASPPASPSRLQPARKRLRVENLVDGDTAPDEPSQHTLILPPTPPTH